MKRSVGIAIAVVVIVVIAAIGAYLVYGQGGSSSGKVELKETGSTLLYPVFNVWAGNYTAAKLTTAGTGSGTGQAQAIAGTVQIGASDAFLTNTQMQQNPGMLNVPILISSQDVAYNIPGGLNSQTLKFSGAILTGIYNGTITNWNDTQIAAMNPGVTLPNHVIIPVHRSDGSGDTNMFTEFLSKSDSWWNSNVGYGTNVNWPSVTAGLTGAGNSGLISQMTSTPYSISYIATTYSAQLQSAGFGIAALQNQAGLFVKANQTTVMSAANQYLNQIPSDGRLAIQYAPGSDSYPIVALEYLIVKMTQPNAATASALKAFLSWVVDPTNGGSQSKFITPLNLAPLPSAVVSQITTPLINKITS